jgi:hypothetical protein
VALIRLKPPCIKWANACSADGREYSREYFEKSCTAILIPAYITEEEAQAYINTNWEEIFDEVLASWNTDKTLWPHNRTPDMFWKWFSVEFCSMVLDADGEPIKKRL